MTRRLLTAVLYVCCMAAMTVPARSQERNATRIQAFVLEIRIVEMTGAQPDDIEKIERGGDHLTRLIGEGKAKVVASLHVRTRAGESFSARVGQRVPIQTGSVPVFLPVEPSRRGGNQPVPAQATSSAFPQISYENTGLNVDGGSTAFPDGTLDIKLRLEMSGIDRSTGSLTPTFMQRTLTDVVRMKESETTIPMGLIQQEAPWSSPAQGLTGATNPSRGSFIVLLTTKSIQ